MTMSVTEWAVECGYISLITNAILGKAETGTKEFKRSFRGDVECFREYCRMQRNAAHREGRHDSVVYIEHCLDDLKEATS